MVGSRSRTAGRATTLLAGVAAGLALIAVTACRPGGQQPQAGGTPTASASPATSPAVSPAVSPSPAPSPPAPSRTAPATPAGPTTPAGLRPGASGPAVLALQQRLVGLGYWLGPADGRYGSATQHAVTAFQKVTGLSRDGVAGPATMHALDQAGRPRARSGSGRLIEVDLAHQVMLVVAGGRVQWVLDVSTGRVAGTTPTGHYTVFRQVDGYDQGPLGVLYRPKYFVGGVAVHGYPDVPPYPASHGCVRVTNAAMDWLWSSGTLPIGTPVWVY